jgi:hypothetical protein
VLGNSDVIQIIGLGIISSGQITPAENIRGIELKNTTNITNSRLGRIAPNHLPIKQLESKKGIKIANIVDISASRDIAYISKLTYELTNISGYFATKLYLQEHPLLDGFVPKADIRF